MNKKFWYLTNCIFLTFSACTENPFFTEDQINRKSIHGRVILSGHSDQKDVVVWLERLDISTRTDEKGNFTLNLPLPSMQPGGGINETLNIFFYAANYNPNSVSVAFRNGQVAFGRKGIDDKGKVVNAVRLFESIYIDFRTSPTEVSAHDSINIYTEISLKAVDDFITASALFAENRFKDDTLLVGGFIRRINSPELFYKYVYDSTRTYVKSNFTVSKTEKKLVSMFVKEEANALPPGEYEIVPYFVIHNPKVPSNLLESIGDTYSEFGPGYFKMPVKFKGNRFRVIREE